MHIFRSPDTGRIYRVPGPVRGRRGAAFRRLRGWVGWVSQIQ